MKIVDWETKLVDYVESVMDMPIRYGVHDCTTFAAKCVEVMTGTNPIADVLGSYKSKKESKQLIKSLCPSGDYSELIKIRCERLGYKETSRAFAARGDIVEYNTPEGIGLGVCLGNTFAAVGPRCLRHYGMGLALKIYKVD